MLRWPSIEAGADAHGDAIAMKDAIGLKGSHKISGQNRMK
jgi:hypothetical protein